MKTQKTLLSIIIIQFSLSTMALAGDVEIHLPAASDAMTVDQPAGTELMRVDGNGNVGIGTAEPASILDILANTSASITLRDGDAAINEPGHQAGLQIYDGGGNRTGVIGFSTSFEGISIRNFNDDGGVSFSTGGNANQAVITADGNVGIGTASPSSELHISDNNSDDVGQLIISGGAAGNISMKSHIVNDTQLMSLGSLTVPEAINIKNNGGNVGIGTSDPTVKLHVAGPETWIDSAGGYAETRYTSATKLGDWSVGTGGSADDGFYIFDYNAPAADRNRLYIDNSGNMRVGGLLGGPIASKLDVLGNIKVADEGFPCDADREGQIRYEKVSKKHQGCDGTSWNNLY